MRRIIAVILGAVLLGACNSDQSPLPYSSQSYSLSPHNRGKSLDDVFADLGKRVTGFGGMYLDHDRTVNIVLVDPRSREAARTEIAMFLRNKAYFRLNGLHPETFRFVSGRFSFTQLKSWYDAFVDPAFSEANVISTDIDERNNRIVVGVTSAEYVKIYRDRFIADGIPAAAFTVVVKPKKAPATTLADNTDTVRAGWKITSPRGGGCSVGAIVHFAGSSTKYVLTAMHCSYFGSVEGGAWYQPTSSRSFGVEQYEGGTWSCGTGCVEMYADVSMVDFSYGLTAGFPYIQGVTGWNSITIYNANTDAIADVDYSPGLGYPITKLGAYGGLDAGEITATCQNATYNDSWPGDGITQFKVHCMYETDISPSPGDSGGIYFYVTTFYGITTGVDFNPPGQIQTGIDSLVYF